jgi:hypothetical protein
MSSAAIAYLNRAASVAASSQENLLLVTRLLDVHVARKWRGSGGTSEYLTLDLGAAYSIDTVALMGVNLTAVGSTRVRASLSDATATGTLLYDSGSVAGNVDPSYGYFIELLPAAVTVRYIRIDLTDATLTYIEAGRVFAGLRHQVEISFAPGFSRAWVDQSTKTRSRGGQTYIDRNVSYRTMDLMFEGVTEDDRWGLFEEVDRLNGERDDVLLITNPDSDNLGRDSIWGLLTQTPVTQITTEFYSKTLQITERL